MEWAELCCFNACSSSSTHACIWTASARWPEGSKSAQLAFRTATNSPNLDLTPSHRTDLAETAASALLPRALEPGIYSATFIFSLPKIFYP